MTLIVNDLNDEKPRFTQNSYEFVLDVNQLSRLGDNKTIDIGSVFAIDLDKADQGKLKFELKDGDADQFALNKRGFGECAIQMPIKLVIDQSIYKFNVRVNDLNGQMSETAVSVRIEAKNLFSQLRWSQEEAYSSSIKENSPPGTQLIGVIIEVEGLPDNLQKPQYQLGYKLAESNEYFEIEEKTGVIEKF